MFLFPFYLSDSYLFYFRASCVSFLIAFFFLVFDEIIVFSVFFYFYLVFLCWSLFILSSISVVIHWLLVFCIFIYSCNYILVFSSISSSPFLLFRCLISWSPAVFLIRHYLWLIIYLFFLSSLFLLLLFYVFCFLSFLFLILLKSLRNYFFMHLLNNINI